MGHILHHAIIVSTWDEKRIQGAHGFAKATGASVSDVITSNINGEMSFLFGPDGSKSGWGEDKTGDQRRDAMITWLKGQRYEDGSNAFQWVEVAYGSDDQNAQVTRHEWDEYRGDADGEPDDWKQSWTDKLLENLEERLSQHLPAPEVEKRLTSIRKYDFSGS